MSENSVILPNEYLTEIRIIDEQHHQIASLLDELCQIVIESHIENRLDHRISNLLADIIETTRHHFNTEQELMQRYKYAEIRNHCEEHAELFKEIISIQKCCESGDMVLSYRILRHLIDEWFLKHISDMDKDLGLYLLSKGAA